ncbi:Gal/GalNAc lectin Igl1, putative, partial [Entamoeba histolytica HM-3:IMSS]
MFILLLFISISLGDYKADKLIDGKEPREAVPHCASVSNGACVSCDTGYELKNNGNSKTCTLKENICKTAFSYYDNTNSTNPKCTYCVNGKEVKESGNNNDKCECKNNVTSCDICLFMENNKCSECIIGMYATSNNGGQKLCDNASSEDHATNCIGLSATTTSTKQCDKCFGNYTLQSNMCSNSVTKINKCILQVENSCNQCADGYYADDNKKKCTKYPDFCSKMNGNQCSGCMEGYYLSKTDSKCTICTVDNPNNLSEGNECSIYNTEHCTSCNKRCTVSNGVC